MYTRNQLILLTALHSAKECCSENHFYTLLSRIKNETELKHDQSFYDFVHTDILLSFELDKDINTLSTKGIINHNSNNDICLDQVAWKRLRKKVDSKLYFEILKVASSSNPSQSDNPNQMAFRDKPAKYGDKTFFTIGYEGKSIDTFFCTLLDKGINNLIDIRNNPISRKYGFSKRYLSNFCERLNIIYCHFPQLGIPKSFRQTLSTDEDYQLLFLEYEQHILPKQTDTLQKVSDLIRHHKSALLCFEKEHQKCHRSRLARRLTHETGIKCNHIENV